MGRADAATPHLHEWCVETLPSYNCEPMGVSSLYYCLGMLWGLLGAPGYVQVAYKQPETDSFPPVEGQQPNVGVSQTDTPTHERTHRRRPPLT
jgi:hypothetical protein